MGELHTLGKEGLAPTLIAILNNVANVDSAIIIQRNKEGDSSVHFANCDGLTACYFSQLLNWTIYEQMELQNESENG